MSNEHAAADPRHTPTVTSTCPSCDASAAVRGTDPRARRSRRRGEPVRQRGLRAAGRRATARPTVSAGARPACRHRVGQRPVTVRWLSAGRQRRQPHHRGEGGRRIPRPGTEGMFPVDGVAVRDVQHPPRDRREGRRVRLNIGIIHRPTARGVPVRANVPAPSNRLPAVLLIGQPVETGSQAITTTRPVTPQQPTGRHHRS